MFLTDEITKIETTKIRTRNTRINFSVSEFLVPGVSISEFRNFLISCFEYFNFLISQFRPPMLIHLRQSYGRQELQWINNFEFSGSHIRLPILILLLSLIILLPDTSYSIEGMDVNITYPFTPPTELFKDIEEWEYVKSTPPLSPMFKLTSEINRELNYNTELNIGFTHPNTNYAIDVGRKEFSIYDSTKTDFIGTSFQYNEDSISLRYRNTTWFDLKKETFSFTSYLITEKDGYLWELFANTDRFDRNYDYTISSNLHRLYGYANMLSIGLGYSHSPCFVHRKRIFHIRISDRFAYEDFLFIIPGIKAEVISQTSFTPSLHAIYLINKYFSCEVKLDGKSYETDLNSNYSLPYITFPESLEAPLNLTNGTLQMNAVIDTSFLVKISICSRKTKQPIFGIEKGNHFLSYKNMDTTITFTSFLLNFKVLKNLFALNSDFYINYTPFYKQKLPYFPFYRLSMDIDLYLSKPISFLNNIQYVSQTYDGNGEEIESYYILCSTLELKILKNASMDVGVLNISNNMGRFIGDVYFPGRTIRSGVKILF